MRLSTFRMTVVLFIDIDLFNIFVGYRLDFDDNICSSSGQSSEPKTKKKNKKKKNKDHADRGTVESNLETDGVLSADDTVVSGVQDHQEDAASAMKLPVEESNTKTEVVDNNDAVVEDIGPSMEDKDVTATETKECWDGSSSEVDEGSDYRDFLEYLYPCMLTCHLVLRYVSCYSLAQ